MLTYYQLVVSQAAELKVIKVEHYRVVRPNFNVPSVVHFLCVVIRVAGTQNLSWRSVQFHNNN
jgi:hypothetical protein